VKELALEGGQGVSFWLAWECFLECLFIEKDVNFAIINFLIMYRLWSEIEVCLNFRFLLCEKWMGVGWEVGEVNWCSNVRNTYLRGFQSSFKRIERLFFAECKPHKWDVNLFTLLDAVSQLLDDWIFFLLPTHSIRKISGLCQVSRDRVRAVREGILWIDLAVLYKFRGYVGFWEFSKVKIQFSHERTN
jgi:hypothetical protein